MRFILKILTLTLLSFATFAQNVEVADRCREASSYMSETLNFSAEFLDNVKKAQNATFTQDISLYLDIGFTSFDQACTSLKYAEDAYLTLLSILEKDTWPELSNIAGKAYNQCLLVENEFSRILSLSREINGNSDLVQIQQLLSSIRFSADNAGYYLLQCGKYNMQISDILKNEDEETEEKK